MKTPKLKTDVRAKLVRQAEKLEQRAGDLVCHSGNYGRHFALTGEAEVLREMARAMDCNRDGA